MTGEAVELMQDGHPSHISSAAADEMWGTRGGILSGMEPDTHSPSLGGLDAALSEAEFDRLEALLDLNARADAMNVEEMDGFFAALICGPEAVSAAVYLDEIWGGAEAPFGTMAELNEFLGLARRHWNSIAGRLASPDEIFTPLLFAEEGEELPRGNRWARGFMRGVSLCSDSWQEIFKEEDRYAMMLPVLVLAHEHDPDPEMRSWKTPPDKEVRETVLVELAVSVRRLFDHFRAQRTHKAPARRAGPKIGRNDPCSCGSGKKYKRCCGNATVQ